MRKFLKVCFLIAFAGFSAVVLTGLGVWWAINSTPGYYAAASQVTAGEAETHQAVAELEASVESLSARLQGRGLLTAFGLPQSPEPPEAEFRITARQFNSWIAVEEARRNRGAVGDVSKVRFDVVDGAVTAGMTLDIDGFTTVVSLTMEPQPVRGHAKPLRLVGFSIGRLPVPMSLLTQLPPDLLKELELKRRRGGLELDVDLSEFSDEKLPLRDVTVDGSEVVLHLGGGPA